jgi:hypothetical protein
MCTKIKGLAEIESEEKGEETVTIVRGDTAFLEEFIEILGFSLFIDHSFHEDCHLLGCFAWVYGYN